MSTPRPGPDDHRKERSASGRSVLAAALLAIGLAGCNGQVVFVDTIGAGGTSPGAGGIIGVGGGVGGNTGAGGDNGTGGNGNGGKPGDAGIGGAAGDAAPDGDAGAIDGTGGRVDAGTGGAGTGGRDAAVETAPPTDGPKDAADAASGPVLCTTDSECGLPSLHCQGQPGQPGPCVECTSNTQCKTNYCDLTLNRCVECLTATQCPSLSTERGSSCSATSGRCLTGCDDDVTATPCPTATRALSCLDATHLCVECKMDSDCQTSPNGAYCHRTDFVCVHCLDDTNCGTGQICDPLAGRCVGCQTSKDCHAPGLPLCDPATLTCVAKP